MEEELDFEPTDEDWAAWEAWAEACEMAAIEQYIKECNNKQWRRDTHG